MDKTIKKKLSNKFLVAGILGFPLFSSLYIVSINSKGFFNDVSSLLLLIFSSLTFVLFVLGIVFKLQTKNEGGKKLKKMLASFLYAFAVFYVGAAYFIVTILYYPGSAFKDWLITTAMTTMRHQYFATWFYDDYEINRTLSENMVIESGEDTDPDLIEFTEPDFNAQTYKNAFEKQILTRENEDDVYKIIDLEINGYSAKLTVVYDPSKVILGVSKYLGNAGQMIYDIAANYDGTVALNGGGFYDPGEMGNGGMAHGVVISQGKLVANNIKLLQGGGIIGFNQDNKLILSRMSAQQAINAGIRDAVEFGPFLIVNGQSSFIKGNGGWGTAPRSAIGQRADGIVLLLVVDGRIRPGREGVDMNDMARTMLNYGAINAANLDGGTSSAMTENGKIINDPKVNYSLHRTRRIPNAWVVLK